MPGVEQQLIDLRLFNPLQPQQLVLAALAVGLLFLSDFLGLFAAAFFLCFVASFDAITSCRLNPVDQQTVDMILDADRSSRCPRNAAYRCTKDRGRARGVPSVRA